MRTGLIYSPNSRRLPFPLNNGTITLSAAFGTPTSTNDNESLPDDELLWDQWTDAYAVLERDYSMASVRMIPMSAEETPERKVASNSPSLTSRVGTICLLGIHLEAVLPSHLTICVETP